MLDPTTFAPSILAYQFTMRDWDTSQTFFAHGFVEHNSRFTATGLPDDTPLAYDAGRRQILRDALVGVEVSAVQNVTTRLVERSLIERYPEHARLIKTAGWIERISFASIMAYKLSAPHYRQWQLNQQLAFQYGF